MLALLVATAVGIGGLTNGPHPLRNVTITVRTPKAVVAYSTLGNISLRVPRGVYGLEAHLDGNPFPCDRARWVRLGFGRNHYRRVTLACSIK